MNISKSRKDWILAVVSAVVLGAAGSAAWDGMKHLFDSGHVVLPVMPHLRLAAFAQLISYILIALIGVLIGRNLPSIQEITADVLPMARPKLSRVVVLEVEGTKPLDDNETDWKFFLTSCHPQMIRSVQLSNIDSEIEAYGIHFGQITVMHPGQRVEVPHYLFAQRHDERYGNTQPTLWDFANSHAGRRGSNYLWYRIHVEYQDLDSDSVRDGGWLAVCFDVRNKRLTVENADFFLAEQWKNF
jgi:hypothetical protein